MLIVALLGDGELLKEATKLVNSTEYGPAAGVCTPDLSRSHCVTHRQRAGTLWVNSTGSRPQHARCGVGASG